MPSSFALAGGPSLPEAVPEQLPEHSWSSSDGSSITRSDDYALEAISVVDESAIDPLTQDRVTNFQGRRCPAVCASGARASTRVLRLYSESELSDCPPRRR